MTPQSKGLVGILVFVVAAYAGRTALSRARHAALRKLPHVPIDEAYGDAGHPERLAVHFADTRGSSTPVLSNLPFRLRNAAGMKSVLQFFAWVYHILVRRNVERLRVALQLTSRRLRSITGQSTQSASKDARGLCKEEQERGDTGHETYSEVARRAIYDAAQTSAGKESEKQPDAHGAERECAVRSLDVAEAQPAHASSKGHVGKMQAERYAPTTGEQFDEFVRDVGAWKVDGEDRDDSEDDDDDDGEEEAATTAESHDLSDEDDETENFEDAGNTYTPEDPYALSENLGESMSPVSREGFEAAVFGDLEQQADEETAITK